MGFVLAACLAASGVAKDQPFDPSKDPARKTVALTPLDAITREGLLQKRVGVGPLGLAGTFNSYASFLYVGNPSLVVHTDTAEIGKAGLRNTFPKGYRPTVRELFELIARQTQSSWSYDESRAYWVFARPAAPLPFRLELATGWKSESRGDYLFCQPPSMPVGLDVYAVHTFSAEDSERAQLTARSRENAALAFIRQLKPGVAASDMQVIQLGTHETLFYTTTTPREGVTWRQWSIAENGQQIVVVSALEDSQREKLLPQIEGMIASLVIEAPRNAP